VSPARWSCGAIAVLLALWPWPVFGQRIQFPTAIPTNVAAPPASSSSGGITSGAGATYSTSAPAYSGGPAPAWSPPPSTYGSTPPPAYSPPAAPNYSTPPPSTYSSPPLPNYTPPPGYGPQVTPGPGATFQGNIQPAPAWDPYGVPGSQPPTLLPTDPTLPGLSPYPESTYAKMQRLLQQMRADYVWIPGNGVEELALSAFDFGATFGVPFFGNLDSPLLITPGFGLQLWSGPITGPEIRFGMPPQTYSAYLDAAWNPQVTPVFGAELGARIGIYSDFDKVTGESIRVTGHGLVVLSFSPSFQLKGGIMYLDRERIKLLPAGGVIWTPHADLRLEILFPNPKVAKRLTTYGNTDWWLYLRGEYGGGSWTIKDIVYDPLFVPPPFAQMGEPIEIDYNDYRVALGVEFDRFSGISGVFEVGLAFERELYSRDAIPVPGPPFAVTPQFTPNSNVYLRGALAW